MWEHFLWASPAYLVAVAYNSLAPRYGYPIAEPRQWILIQGVLLAAWDYLVHRFVHKWHKTDFPWTTALWLAVATLLLPVDAGIWVVTLLLPAQAMWDNVWHARSHHRADGQPLTPLDREWILLACVLWACAILYLSRLIALRG